MTLTVKQETMPVTANEYAALSYGAYGQEKGEDVLEKVVEFSGGKVKKNDFDLVESSKNYMVVRKVSTGEYVLAVKGTSNTVDVLSDLGILLGIQGSDPRIYELVNVLRKYKKNGDEISVTGHSLGGTLAAELAKTESVLGVVFNMGAGLGEILPTNIAIEGLRGGKTDNVINFYTKGDVLSMLSLALGRYQSFEIDMPENPANAHFMNTFRGLDDAKYQKAIEGKAKMTREYRGTHPEEKTDDYSLGEKFRRAAFDYAAYKTSKEALVKFYNYVKSGRVKKWGVDQINGLHARIIRMGNTLTELKDALAARDPTRVYRALRGVQGEVAQAVEDIGNIPNAANDMMRVLGVDVDGGVAPPVEEVDGGVEDIPYADDAVGSGGVEDIPYADDAVGSGGGGGGDDGIGLGFDDDGIGLGFDDWDSSEFNARADKWERDHPIDDGEFGYEDVGVGDGVSGGGGGGELQAKLDLIERENLRDTERIMGEIDDILGKNGQKWAKGSHFVKGVDGVDDNYYDANGEITLPGEDHPYVPGSDPVGGDVGVGDVGVVGGDMAVDAAVDAGNVAFDVVLRAVSVLADVLSVVGVLVGIGFLLYDIWKPDEHDAHLRAVQASIDGRNADYDGRLKLAAGKANVTIPPVPAAVTVVAAWGNLVTLNWRYSDVLGGAGMAYLNWRADNPGVVYKGSGDPLSDIIAMAWDLHPEFPFRVGDPQSRLVYARLFKGVKTSFGNPTHLKGYTDKGLLGTTAYHSELEMDDIDFALEYKMYGEYSQKTYGDAFKTKYLAWVKDNHAQHKVGGVEADGLLGDRLAMLKKMGETPALHDPQYKSTYDGVMKLVELCRWVEETVLGLRVKFRGVFNDGGMSAVSGAASGLRQAVMSVVGRGGYNDDKFAAWNKNLSEFVMKYDVNLLHKGFSAVLGDPSVLLYYVQNRVDLGHFQTYLSLGAVGVLGGVTTVDDYESKKALVDEKIRTGGYTLDMYYAAGWKPRGDRETVDEFSGRFEAWRRSQAGRDLSGEHNAHATQPPVDPVGGTSGPTGGGVFIGDDNLTACQQLNPSKKRKVVRTGFDWRHTPHLSVGGGSSSLAVSSVI